MGISLRRFTTNRDCLSMKLSLALFLLVALIVILLPDDSEASPLRRQRARRVQALRRARNFRGQRKGPYARRGRTGMGADAPPPPPEGADDAAAGGEDGEGGEEVPDWCNPTIEMGVWLNYKNPLFAARGELRILDPMEESQLKKAKVRKVLKKLKKHNL